VGSDEVIVIDTHVLVWADCNDRRLGRTTRALIDRAWPSGKVAVPSIAFWEVAMLQAQGHLSLKTTASDWREAVLAAGALELPLDGNIALRAFDLAGLHGDPADRFIVATALVHGAALITADERLLAWQHPHDRHDART
jgi:PIN domain nuclease of toxin-antitoxin system